MVFDIHNILKAYYSCRKGKRNSLYALCFENNYEEKIYNLAQDLITHRYRIGQSTCFVITYPTIREIFAANFTDRVVHHLLINHIGEKIDKTFIYDSFACRKSKGTISGVKRLRKFINKIILDKRSRGYYLKLDIRSFFYSIDKQILFSILIEKINCLDINTNDKEELIWLSSKIISHNPCMSYKKKGSTKILKSLPKDKSLFTTTFGKGLAIGNLTSQFFANLYLDKLDQFVKRELKVKYYLRYADDMLFLSKNTKDLKNIEIDVTKFLKEELKLDIKGNKTKYGKISEGIDFLGYIVKPEYTLNRRRVVNNIKKKLHYFNKGYLINRKLCMEEFVPLGDTLKERDIENICASINSAFGHLKWSNSYRLRQNLYTKHFGILTEYLDPQGNLESFRPSKPSI